MVQEVTYNGGAQTIRHLLSQYVTTASVKLEDPRYSPSDSSRVLFEGAATIPTFSFGLDTEVSPSSSYPFRLEVDDASEVDPGDKLFIVDPNGHSEFIVVNSVNESSDYIDLAWPILTHYSSGSLFHSAEISVTFPAASASVESYIESNYPLLATFSYTGSNGSIVSYSEQIRFVRRSGTDFSEGGALEKIKNYFPDLVTRASDTDPESQLRRFVKESYGIVRMDLDAFTPADEILLGEQGLWLVVWQTAIAYASNGLAPNAMTSEEFMRIAEKNYNTRLQNIKVGLPGYRTADIPKQTDTVSYPQSEEIRSFWEEM